MAAVHITRDGDMLDLIAYHYYGTSSGTVEAILVANFGLCEQPPVLPAGLRIVLPDVARPTTPAPVRLWS